MFSKPLAFVLLALACLTAAAGGAYFAARHNESEAAAATLAAPAKTPVTVQAGTTEAPAPQPVAETEAAVSAKAPEVKPLAEAAPAEAPAPAPPPTVRRESKTAAKAAPVTPAAPAARTETPASRPPQRPGTANGGPAPVTQAEPASAPQPAPPASAAPQTKQAEPVKPIEEPQPEPARVPQFEEVILPASAVIGLQVETATSTERARVEDRIDARVSRDVMAAGRVAIPAGSRMIGSVTTVERGGKMKEQARLGIRFHTLVLSAARGFRSDRPVMRLATRPLRRARRSAAPRWAARSWRDSRRRQRRQLAAHRRGRRHGSRRGRRCGARAPPGRISQRQTLVARDHPGSASQAVDFSIHFEKARTLADWIADYLDDPSLSRARARAAG